MLSVILPKTPPKTGLDSAMATNLERSWDTFIQKREAADDAGGGGKIEKQREERRREGEKRNLQDGKVIKRGEFAQCDLGREERGGGEGERGEGCK